MNPIPDLDALSLDEKIGQMLCFGWRGDDCLHAVNAHARECIREMRVGGMVVMGRNVQRQDTRPPPPVDLPAVRAMRDEMQELAALPLLLPTDQEGGRVARFGAPFTRFPAAGVIGQAGDIDLARQAARITGEELAQAGINMNFAPCADVNSNPANPVIGDRAFGATPEVVAPMVRAQIAGYADAGILSCAKHFPGHGDTSLDSHLALPTVTGDRDAMEARELIPFCAAIDAGVDAIMTAHILFPALDPARLPATLSATLLTGLLRERLGFDGLIVTDCLEMKAVADYWGTARAALLAAKAGADLLLVCHTPERQRATRAMLLDAARTGDLPLDRIDDAVTRILAAKRRLADAPPPDLARIGSPGHAAVARAIAKRAEVPWAAPAAPTTLGAEAVD